MSARKTIEQRADEVINKFRDWNDHNRASIEERRQYLRGLICEAIVSEQHATVNRLHYGSQRIRPPVPKEFPPFPFKSHRTLAQVDQAKEPA